MVAIDLSVQTVLVVFTIEAGEKLLCAINPQSSSQLLRLLQHPVFHFHTHTQTLAYIQILNLKSCLAEFTDNQTNHQSISWICQWIYLQVQYVDLIHLVGRAKIAVRPPNGDKWLRATQFASSISAHLANQTAASINYQLYCGASSEGLSVEPVRVTP